MTDFCRDTPQQEERQGAMALDGQGQFPQSPGSHHQAIIKRQICHCWLSANVLLYLGNGRETTVPQLTREGGGCWRDVVTQDHYMSLESDSLSNIQFIKISVTSWLFQLLGWQRVKSDIVNTLGPAGETQGLSQLSKYQRERKAFVWCIWYFNMTHQLNDKNF